MATLRPKRTASIDEFIEAGESVKITYDVFSLQDTVTGYDDVSMSRVTLNVLDDYIDDFKELSETITLTDAQFSKYCQAPKIFCDAMYGNMELDFVIMRLNDICDPRDFNMRTIKILSKSDMTSLLSKVYSANKKFINIYNERNNA
jgi:hypothetical protein